MELTKSFLVEAVPDVDETVGAARREGVEAAVERDRVDGEDLLVSILLDTMTLERILLLLDFGTRVHVLDGHTRYDTRIRIIELILESMYSTATRATTQESE